MLTKILAVIGTILMYFSILTPILVSIQRSTIWRKFMYDYQMSSELIPTALIGGAILLWAALRSHSRQKFIGYGISMAMSFPIMLGLIKIKIIGWNLYRGTPVGITPILLIATFYIYEVALITLGIGGMLILRDLFKKPESGGKDDKRQPL